VDGANGTCLMIISIFDMSDKPAVFVLTVAIYLLMSVAIVSMFDFYESQ
jgi:hypothetical protein